MKKSEYFFKVTTLGFSLLELMIVLTIMAILAAIAIPNYQLYVKKAKFSEVISRVMPYKTAIEVCAQLLGGLSDGQTNCGTSGVNEVPNDFVSDVNDKHYVSSIRTRYQKPDVLITVLSKGLGPTYSYILNAQVGGSGALIWTLDSASSCLSAGLCHVL